MRVAYIGLGAMGYPIAGHIGKAFSTVVWNRTAEVARRHADEFGTTAAATLEEAVAGADIIGSCVPTSAVVDDLVRRCEGALKPGAIWADNTSGHPETAKATAERLASHGVTYLDAPVSGGPGGAKAGTLTVMVGGDPDALERARPVVSTYAGKVVHVGGLGAGHAVKAINNVMMAINLWGASEGLLALERSGVEVATALSVINASSGRSFASEGLLPEPLTTGEYPLRFKLSLLHKDAGIALDVARATGGPSPLTALATELLGVARGMLPPDADYIEVARALRALCRPPLGAPDGD